MTRPFLIGETIYLREILEEDLSEAYQQWFNDAEVCQYNSHHRFPNYRQNMEEYYESVIRTRQHLILAIVDKETDTHIGNISLQDIDSLNQSAEFAIIVGDKAFWGKHIGTEASRLIIGHGFRELHLHRIFCGTSSANKAMQALAVRLGFVEEGKAREALFKQGQWNDIIYYGLLETDFKKDSARRLS